MKQCPVCKTTYTDETLRYCLADGSALADLGSDQTVIQHGAMPPSDETVSMGMPGAQVRIDIPRRTAEAATPAEYQPRATAGGSTGGVYKILIAVLALGILALLVVIAGTFIYFKMGGSERAAVENANKEIKATSPSPTPPSGDSELRDKIANLESRLNDPKKANLPASTANLPFAAVTTARVNSPNDHFLALRTLPNSQAGARIYQIPDGVTISVGACSNSSRLGDKIGHWCQASYKGYSGWVFDAFLVY